MKTQSLVSKIILGFTVSLFTCTLWANLTTSLNGLISHQQQSEKIGIYIKNLNTGAVLYAHNSAMALTPASTTKVFTAAAAYLALGRDYRYTTTLSANVPLAPILKGNVYIHFSGDPTLSSLDLNALMHQMRLRGVKKIEGNVVLDQTYFTGSYYGIGWTPVDFERCYGAPISAAIINGNCTRGGVVQAPVPYAQKMVDSALYAAGIHLAGKTLEGKLPPHPILIASHQSASLQTILSFMLKYSDDVYANALFKTLGRIQVNNGSYQGGALAVRKILNAHLGKGFKSPQLKDGSGLSTLDQITPQQLVALFNYMYHSPTYSEVFRLNLPISGQGGTLVHRLNNRLLAGNVYAKTGTFHQDEGGVSTLAGYLILPGGHPPIGFAIMMNHLAGDTGRAQDLQDQIVTAIAESEIQTAKIP